MNKFLFTAFLLSVKFCFGQENVSVINSVTYRDSIGYHYCNNISSDSISKTLYTLASPEMEGRETGQRGQRIAAAYLSKRYESFGLIPFGNTDTATGINRFLQKHYMHVRVNNGRNLSVNGENFLYGRDFFYESPPKDTSLFLNNIIFSASSLNDLNTIIKSDRYNSKNILYFGNDENKLNFDEVRPGAVFEITTAEKINSYFVKGSSGSHYEGYFHFYITENVAKNFFDKTDYQKLLKKGKRKSVVKEVECEVSIGLLREDSALTGHNVVAMLKGSNSGGEAIVISSHYDHLGKADSLIYFGADDNASGTSAIIEMARVFSMAAENGQRPKRDIIFLNVSGEEKGLFGSSYYVSHPPLPLKNIVANLNIDMIGRIDSIHDSTGVSDYIYVIGADKLSTELHNINEDQNSKFLQMELDYKYNNEEDPNYFYRRSDHYNFAKKGIPVIFYFDGKHADYHLPSDTPDKINMKLLSKRAQLVFLTAWELANRENRIVVNKK